MAAITHRFVEANGMRMHVAEAGTGPVVLLCHGYPESWYSWRHQIAALASAGFHAVAPDMRGYGQTDQPGSVEQYTLLHIVGDMVGLLDALGETVGVIAGHDWGALAAWTAALLRPDRFRGVVGLSVPYLPRGAVRPTSVMPRTDEAVFYQLYFQAPGVAEAELEAELAAYVRGILVRFSGDFTGAGDAGMVPLAGGLRALLARSRGRPPVPLPGWLTQADVDFLVAEFARSGLRGGLNWYRNIDRNWELLAPFEGAGVVVPALFVGGERDPVLDYPAVAEAVAKLRKTVPLLRGTVMLPGCGHWVQQERPGEVSAAMVGFIGSL